MVILNVLLALQSQASTLPPHASAAPAAGTVRATRAATPPVLDGRDDDAIWRATPAVAQFLEAKPSEGAAPKHRTGGAHRLRPAPPVRLHPRPRSPPRQHREPPVPPGRPDGVGLRHRDARPLPRPAHGYEFSVNPAGVKTDYAIYNDGTEDVAWDAVWDAATRIDSLGWTAEYRIPLSQLHFTPRAETSFGILLWRVIQRHTATVTWPLYRPSRSGLTSQFGELTGLVGLRSPGHGEITPYLVTKNVEGPPAADFARDQEITAGADVRYRLASNLLLNATVNPDFGQIEADPSELNLSAFETFFEERRPFFVEGKGLFTFTVNCVVVVDCDAGEGLFYSRRIGRSPQRAGALGDESSPTSTRILGAAKVTGRLPGGFALGVLDAVTDDVAGPVPGTTLEPTTNYAVVRATQDYRDGDGSVGFVATAVNRSLDASSEPYLRRSAYTGGIDARRRFAERFEVSASFDASRVAGSAAAIALTQRDAAHLYQRPDGPASYDSTRTSLSGTNLELRFAKVGGRRLQFETAYQRRSPGFEINDIGFLRQADQQAWTSWAALAFRTPNRVFQELRWNFNNWDYPVHLVAQRDLGGHPERRPVLRDVRRSRGGGALHLRAPRADDAEPHLAAGLQLHAERVAPGLRLTVHLQGDVRQRARGGRRPGGGVRRALPAVRRSRGGRRSGRVQRAGVPVERGVPVGVSGGVGAVPGVESGGGVADVEGTKSFGGDLSDLFGRRANDTFLMKVSYWLAR